MFFIVTQSSHGSHRIFVDRYSNASALAVLKNESMWGGHDKSFMYDGIDMIGFEVKDEKLGEVISRAINAV